MDTGVLQVWSFNMEPLIGGAGGNRTHVSLAKEALSASISDSVFPIRPP